MVDLLYQDFMLPYESDSIYCAMLIKQTRTENLVGEKNTVLLFGILIQVNSLPLGSATDK